MGYVSPLTSVFAMRVMKRHLTDLVNPPAMTHPVLMVDASLLINASAIRDMSHPLKVESVNQIVILRVRIVNVLHRIVAPAI